MKIPNVPSEIDLLSVTNDYTYETKKIQELKQIS
jgi:hypothetical protein